MRRYLIRNANKGEPGALAELGRIYAGGNSRVFKQDYEEAYYCFSLCLKNKTKDPEDQQEWKEVEKSRDYTARKLTSSQMASVNKRLKSAVQVKELLVSNKR